MNSVKDIYSDFIRVRTYARWIDKEQRRETWDETVDRYKTYFLKRVPKGLEGNFEEAIRALRRKDVMPSMRALWTSGDALDKDNVAGFNCSYLTFDHIKRFGEMIYLLMCGTGVGFSVERQYISQLPTVEVINDHKLPMPIIVEDSKVGWAEALNSFFNSEFSGRPTSINFDKLRPEGSRLKTFGGRSSGPEPLKQLFSFAKRILDGARGRKLTSLEVHDIATYIASVVIVGGVRRSACISLSNLSDRRMAEAKNGAYWDLQPQRALANNSAVYTEKPDMTIFMEEWLNLIKSGTGERGIVNREAMQIKAEKSGRSKDIEYGTNPSLRKGTRILTTDGILPIEDLEGSKFYIRNLKGVVSEAECFLSGKDKPLYELELQGGHSYFATKEHKWPVYDKRTKSFNKVTTQELKEGDLLPTASPIFDLTKGTLGDNLDGFVVGYNLGDGWITKRSDDGTQQIGFSVEDNKRDSGIHLKIQKYLKDRCGWSGEFLTKKEINVNNKNLNTSFESFKVTHKSKGIPKVIWKEASESFRRGFIDGLFSADGCFSDRVCLTTSYSSLAHDIADLLGFYGIHSTIKSRVISNASFPNGKVYDRKYECYDVCVCKQSSIRLFYNLFTLTNKDKQASLENLLKESKGFLEGFRKVKRVTLTDIKEDVWDIRVYDDTHCFQLAHCITGNCGEISLRPQQFCNLSEIVVRAEDSLGDLLEKARYATIFGILQSTLTDFRFLSDEWKINCEKEDRLLGVSMTGIMDHPVLNGSVNEKPSSIGSRDFYVKAINIVVKETSDAWADAMGITRPTARTSIKPSGTVSQLVDTASGLHPRHSKFYLRRVRVASVDPLAQFLIDKGVPHDPEVAQDHLNPSTWVFRFPIKAPEGSVTRHDVSAKDQLETYLFFRKNYTDHNPSITIYVKDNEWMEIGSMIYNNWNDVSGVSLLPHDGGVYKLAPYEDITAEEYDKLVSQFPKDINFNDLAIYEIEDSTIGSQEYACSAGGCELK